MIHSEAVMSKRGRLLPVIILLMIGGALCLPMLLVVNNPAFPIVPTVTPAFISTVVASVYEPTQQPPLPEQCESNQVAYQLRFIEYDRSLFSELKSPDGEAR